MFATQLLAKMDTCSCLNHVNVFASIKTASITNSSTLKPALAYVNQKIAVPRITLTQRIASANAVRPKHVSIITSGVLNLVSVSALLKPANNLTIIGIFIHVNAPAHLKTVQLAKFGTMMFALAFAYPRFAQKPTIGVILLANANVCQKTVQMDSTGQIIHANANV